MCVRLLCAVLSQARLARSSPKATRAYAVLATLGPWIA